MLEFGKEIRDRRTYLGLTQVEVAKALNLKHTNHISDWEHDKVQPNLRNIKAICEVLKMDLIFRSLDGEYTSKDFGEFIRVMRNKIGYSQTELAEVVGIDNYRPISTYELGKVIPNMYSADDILTALNSEMVMVARSVR